MASSYQIDPKNHAALPQFSSPRPWTSRSSSSPRHRCDLAGRPPAGARSRATAVTAGHTRVAGRPACQGMRARRRPGLTLPKLLWVSPRGPPARPSMSSATKRLARYVDKHVLPQARNLLLPSPSRWSISAGPSSRGGRLHETLYPIYLSYNSSPQPIYLIVNEALR